MKRQNAPMNANQLWSPRAQAFTLHPIAAGVSRLKIPPPPLLRSALRCGLGLCFRSLKRKDWISYLSILEEVNRYYPGKAMAAKFSFGDINFNFSTRGAGAPARERESPFRMAVLGDFSGRSSRGMAESIGQRASAQIDCDNFEKIMARMGAALRLPNPGRPNETLELRFSTLEDFHPDQIIQRVESLSQLIKSRKALLDPTTSSATIAELQRLFVPEKSAPAGPSENLPGAESNEQTLARLLGEAPNPLPATRPGAGGINIDSLIKSIVGPGIVPAPGPQQTALLSALDMELARQLHVQSREQRGLLRSRSRPRCSRLWTWNWLGSFAPFCITRIFK